jgi:hypothetical protein
VVSSYASISTCLRVSFAGGVARPTLPHSRGLRGARWLARLGGSDRTVTSGLFLIPYELINAVVSRWGNPQHSALALFARH